ncbi:UNVERIFIED_CONTAM: Glycerol kinase [Sesamum radiatum]|uniref:Glycerol kinase n=1 Tax=Sesamum radiatum TaxID=300843 RepID=A0AAW2LQN3_SESRA
MDKDMMNRQNQETQRCSTLRNSHVLTSHVSPTPTPTASILGVVLCVSSVFICFPLKERKADSSKKRMAGEQALIGSIDQGTTSTRFIIYDRSLLDPLHLTKLNSQFYPIRAIMLLVTESHWFDQSERKPLLFGADPLAALFTRPLFGWMSEQVQFAENWKKSCQGKNPFCGGMWFAYKHLFQRCEAVWLLENVDAVKEAVKKGDALFGTIDTWLIWNLTGGKENGLHVTDVSNASRTMLMNLKTLEWDKTILNELGIPVAILPKIRCWGKHAGRVKLRALRTGAFILLNTGEEIIKSNHGLLSTLAYKLGPKAPTNYALEGSIAIAGAAVQWLRDSLGIIKTASEIEKLALEVKDVLDSMHKDAGEKGEVKNDKGSFYSE